MKHIYALMLLTAINVGVDALMGRLGINTLNWELGIMSTVFLYWYWELCENEDKN